MITCQFEDGGTGKLRHVTVNAIVVRDGKVLLGRRDTYGNGKLLDEHGKWSLIGGFMGRDESLIDGLKREVLEESGWQVDKFKLLHIKDNPDRRNEDRQNIEFVFFVDAIEKVNESDEEVSQLQWFSLDELPAKDQIAFDHGDDLELYKDYINSKVHVPFMGKYKPA